MKLVTRRRVLALLPFAALAAGALWWDRYRPSEAHYQGRPTARWAEDILSTRAAGVDESGRMVWYGPPTWWERWRTRLGGPPGDWFRQPAVLSGDPAAAAVLAELLRHPEPKVRVVATTALRMAAGERRPTLEGIMETVGPDDAEARRYAEDSLRRVELMERDLRSAGVPLGPPGQPAEGSTRPNPPQERP